MTWMSLAFTAAAAVAAVVLLLPVSVVADVTANLPYTKVVTNEDGVSREVVARKIEFSCEAAAVSMRADIFNDVTNVTTFRTIDCAPPTLTVDAFAIQMVPTQLRIATAFVCTSVDASNLQAVGNFTKSPTARSLQLYDFIFAGIVGGVLGRKDWVQDMYCQVGISGSGCGQPTVDAEMVKFLNSYKDVLLQFGPLLPQIQSNVESLNQANRATNRSISALLGASAAQAALINTSANAIAELGIAFKRLAQQSEDLKAATTAGLAAGLDASTDYADTQVRNLRDQVVLNAENIITYVGDVTDSILKEVKDTKMQGYDTLDTISQFQTAVLDTFANTAVSDALRRLLLAALDQHVADGYVPFVDPNAPGFSKVEVTDDQAKRYVDDTLINIVNNTVTVNIAHQYEYSLQCNALKLFKQVRYGMTWRDFLRVIGPVGCVANATAANPTAPSYSTYCTCWVEIRHTECEVTNSFNWQQITSVDREDYLMTASSPCQGVTPTESNWNGRAIDNIPALHIFFGQLCGTTLKVGTLLQMYSVRTVAVNFPLIGLTSCVSPDIASEFDQPNIFSLLGKVYAGWLLAFPNIFGEYQALKNADGATPNWVTTQVLEMLTQSTGESIKCYLSSIDVIKPTTTIAYAMQPKLPVARIRVRQHTEPAICTSGICIPQGDIISDVTSSSFAETMNIPALGLMLKPEDIVFGELSVGMTSLYDVNKDDRSGALSNRRRKNSFNYLGWNLPDGYDITSTGINPPSEDLAVWRNQNGGDIYDHMGALSLDASLRTVLDGTCTIETDGTRDNQLCQMFDQWFVDPSCDMRQGHCTFYPLEYSYTGRFDAELGDLIVRVGVGCPEILFDSSESGTKLEVRNTLPISVTVVLRQTVSEPSCVSIPDRTLELAPKQIFTRKVPSCGNVTAELLRALDGDITRLQSCGAPIETTIASDFQSELESIGPNITLVTVENVALNAAAAAMQLTFAVLNDYIVEVADIIAPNVTNVQLLDLTNTTITRFQEALDSLFHGIQFLADADRIVNLTTFVKDQANEVIADIVLPLLGDAQTAILDLRAIIAITEAGLNLSNITTGKVLAAFARSLIATDDLIAAYNRRSDASECVNQGGFFANFWCQIVKFFWNVGIWVIVIWIVYKVVTRIPSAKLTNPYAYASVPPVVIAQSPPLPQLPSRSIRAQPRGRPEPPQRQRADEPDELIDDDGVFSI